MENRTPRRVMSGAIGLAAASLLAVMAIAFAGAGVGMASEEVPPLVRIRNWTLNPSVIYIDAGQAIGWRNQTSRAARVVFDRKVARGMVCHEPSRFQIVGLSFTASIAQSGAIDIGCELGPGEYTYRVELRAGQGGDGQPLIPRQLTGRVIVQ